MAQENRTGINPMLSQNRELLGIGNLVQPGRGDLDHVGDHLLDIVRGQEVLVIASAAKNMDFATDRVAKALTERFGARNVDALHRYPQADRKFVLKNGTVLYLAGGITGRLGNDIDANRHEDTGELVDPRLGANEEPIREDLGDLAAEGVSIVGASAGMMVMGDTYRTFGDSRSFVQRKKDGSEAVDTRGLNLLQTHTALHPHYKEGMDEELAEYPEFDTQLTVLALRNGTWFRVEGDQMNFYSDDKLVGGVLFENTGRREVTPGENISQLVR